MAAVPSNQPLLRLWAVEDRPAASHIPNPAASRVCSQVNPCVQGMRRSLGSLPCRAAGMSWHVRGLGQGRNAALLAQWLSQPPTLAGGAEDQRIPGSCWISPKVEQEGRLVGPGGLGPAVPRGDNPVAPGAPAGAATRCSGGAEGLPGLGPLEVVSWLPNSRCVSLEGKDRAGCWQGGAPAPPSLTSFLPVGGAGIALLPLRCCFPEGTQELPGVGTLLAVSSCQLWGGGTGPPAWLGLHRCQARLPCPPWLLLPFLLSQHFPQLLLSFPAPCPVPGFALGWVALEGG